MLQTSSYTWQRRHCVANFCLDCARWHICLPYRNYRTVQPRRSPPSTNFLSKFLALARVRSLALGYSHALIQFLVQSQTALVEPFIFKRSNWSRLHISTVTVDSKTEILLLLPKPNGNHPRLEGRSQTKYFILVAPSVILW